MLAGRQPLRHQALFTVAVSLLLVVVWALTTRAYFWLIHAVLPLATLLALHAWRVTLKERPIVVRRTPGS